VGSASTEAEGVPRHEDEFLAVGRHLIYQKYVKRSGPNLNPGTMRVYVTNGLRNGWNIVSRHEGEFLAVTRHLIYQKYVCMYVNRVGA